MLPDLTVRPAVIEDAEEVFDLLTKFVTSYQPNREAYDRHFPLLVESDQSVFLVAMSQGHVIGYALGSSSLTLYANGPVMELQELMVAPECRSQGIGTRLVKATLEQATALGCAEATVPTRRAREFYVKMGFEETAVFLKRKLPL